MKASLILSVAGLAAAAPQPRTGVPEYYLIRHAEKTGDGSLSAQGLQRAQCLVKVFGKDSKYNIQHIMVQTPHPGSSSEDHRTQRPYNTTLPLAESLGIKIDTPCEYKDYKCAAHHALNDYSGPGNVLIAWEHSNLPLVADAIGVKNAPFIPYNVFDHIYNVPAPYNEVTITSEDCPGLDN